MSGIAQLQQYQDLEAMRQGEPMPVTMTPEARELAPQVAQGIAEAALMFPTGASLPDAMGLQPDPLSDEYYSSMWENLQQGEYVDAALQGLGLGADALTAIGAAGTATGVGAPAGLAAMGAGVGLSGLSTAVLAARRAGRVDPGDVSAAARAEVTPEELAYNEQVRIPSGMLDRDRVLPNDNILYRPDRVYRYIGEGGYADFLESGMVRQKPKGEKTYPVTHYMRGKSSSRYARKESGKYLVEAVPNPEKWRAGGSEYTGSIVPLTAEDQIRIFRRNEDGTFDVVFDNIGDRALLTEPQPSAARGQEPSGSLREQTEQDMENMKNELREYLRNTPAQ